MMVFILLKEETIVLSKIIGHRFNLDEIESELRTNKFDCICSGHEDLLKIFSENKISYKKLSEFLIGKFNIRK